MKDEQNHVRVRRGRGRVYVSLSVPTDRVAFRRWVREVAGDASAAAIERLRVSVLRSLGGGR